MSTSVSRSTVCRGRTRPARVGDVPRWTAFASEKKERLMRIATLALLMCGGCIAGGAVVVHGESSPDDRVMRQVMRQDLWAQQAVNARPNPKQLERIRSGQDPASMDAARKELT